MKSSFTNAIFATICAALLIITEADNVAYVIGADNGVTTQYMVTIYHSHGLLKTGGRTARSSKSIHKTVSGTVSQVTFQLLNDNDPAARGKDVNLVIKALYVREQKFFPSPLVDTGIVTIQCIGTSNAKCPWFYRRGDSFVLPWNNVRYSFDGMLPSSMESRVGSQVDKVLEDYPDLTDQIEESRESIVSHLISGTTPHSSSHLRRLRLSAPTDEESKHASTCLIDFGIVTADVVILVLELSHLFPAVSSRVKGQIAIAIGNLGESALNRIRPIFQAYMESRTEGEKAAHLIKLLHVMHNMHAFRLVFKFLAQDMTAWEWAKGVTLFTLQIAAWIASEGYAFLIEYATLAVHFTDIIRDGNHLIMHC